MPLLNQIMQIKQIRFVPGLMSSLITVLLLPLFVYLGAWQLNRMTEKKGLQDRLESPLCIEWQDSDMNIDRYRYRTIHIQGQFLNEKNILLDNQTFKGRAGYRVFTPFLPKGSQKVLLIDRGWVVCERRSQLPQIAAIAGQIDLTGILNKFSQGITLKKETLPKQIDHWPIRVQSLPFETLASLLNQEVYPFILQLADKSPYGYIALPVNLGISSFRHLGYAVQWFTMAAAILIYYLAINIRRRGL